MLTLKKEKGKQKHPKEKIKIIMKRAQQVGPKPEMACARNQSKKTERAQKWAPSQLWPEKKGAVGRGPSSWYPCDAPITLSFSQS